jgi:Spy/CpxP family protein refolding chaperone
MRKLGIFVTIAFLMVSASLYSQPTDCRDYNKIIKKLKLTEEQKKNVEKIKLDMKKQEIAQKAKIETARLELEQIFKAESPDKSDIEKKLNDIAELEVQMHMIKVDSWFTMNTILTPEQQKIWKEVLVAGPAMKHKMMNRDEHKPMMKNRGKEQMQKREEMSKPN